MDKCKTTFESELFGIHGTSFYLIRIIIKTSIVGGFHPYDIDEGEINKR